MTQKSFLETAILNGTGLWNGYAKIDSKWAVWPEKEYLIHLLGLTNSESGRNKLKQLFKKDSHDNWHRSSLFKTPKSINQIVVVDKDLEHNYGIVGTKSLKTASQCDINFLEKEVPSGVPNFNLDCIDFNFRISFQIKPSIKLEKRAFHSVSIELKYIDDHYDRNIPEFEFKVRVPKCFIEEVNRNPEFLKELKTKLGF